jgi:hypothetical protein
MAETNAFRTIDELAARCGNYCWLENRLFGLTGQAACGGVGAGAGPSDAEVRVFLSEMAPRHASLAAQWRERLPVRAGVDAVGFVVPPAGGVDTVLDLLASERDPGLVLRALVEQILPRLLISYADDGMGASAVSEAPVRAVLAWAGFSLSQEQQEGAALLRRTAPDRGTDEKRAAFRAEIERALGDGLGILPAAWAS